MLTLSHICNHISHKMNNSPPASAHACKSDIVLQLLPSSIDSNVSCNHVQSSSHQHCKTIPGSYLERWLLL